MSECVKCGKELVCDVPTVVGKYKGLASAPHGCPPEYDHFQIRAEDLGVTENEIEKLFNSMEVGKKVTYERE